MTLSAVDHAIINRALLATSHEMGSKLVRSAHSPIVREAQDCSAAIMNARGEVVAQSELIAIQLGSIAHTFAPCLARYPVETIEAGDFFINNDPYSGGQHIPDIFLFTPIFVASRLIGFSASVVHHIDLGGGAPGLNPQAADVHQEGIIFPPTKYNIERDWKGGPFERLIAANVRMPDATIGDINAQFAANAIGARRIATLAEKFGCDDLADAMDEMLNYTERRIRTAIRALPDGCYQGAAEIDDDGLGNGPLTIRAQVKIAGDTIAVDFDGSHQQVGSNINNPFASTYSSTIACLKSVLTDPDIPFNDGVARVISVQAPLGTILNPKPPAPVRARLLPSNRLFNAVMKALAHIAPDKVIAEGFDTTTSICLSHLGPDGYNIYLEILGGGYGAGAHNNGSDGVDCPLSNCANIPLEAVDMDYPFMRMETYQLRDGSAGSGRHQGGMGLERSYRILADDVKFATYCDRFKAGAQGLFGGHAGAPAESLIERGDTVIRLESKTGVTLQRGDRLIIRTGGGGGYGKPETSHSTQEKTQ